MIIHNNTTLCWFGSFPRWKTITYAVSDLQLHSEYIESLRKKIEGPEYIKFSKITKDPSLLDGFIEESMR